MKRLLLATAFLLPAAAQPATADEISDTIQSALEAYEAGDVQYAAEELAFAQQLLNEMQTAGLAEFLPPAPDGWTREINQDMTAGLAVMGGGVGAEATYKNADDTESFKITMMADNPMVAASAGMFGNAAVMASAGKMVRVGREKFIIQNRQLSGLINGRILVTAKGGEPEMLVPVLEQIDFRALGKFGL